MSKWAFGGITQSVLEAKYSDYPYNRNNAYITSDGEIFRPTNWAGKAIVWLKSHYFAEEQNKRTQDLIGTFLKERDEAWDAYNDYDTIRALLGPNFTPISKETFHFSYELSCERYDFFKEKFDSKA